MGLRLVWQRSRRSVLGLHVEGRALTQQESLTACSESQQELEPDRFRWLVQISRLRYPGFAL